MGRVNHTKKVGKKTSKKTGGKTASKKVSKAAIKSGRISLAIANKDPDYDYSMRPINAEADMYGWELVTAGENSGEEWDTPQGSRKTNKSEIRFYDCALYRRHKDASAYYREIENEKYNQQQLLIKQAAPAAQATLREYGDDGATVKQTYRTKGYSQRTGPTE